MRGETNMVEYVIVGLIVLLYLYCVGGSMLKDTTTMMASLITLIAIVVIVYPMVHVIIR
jgi:hypothetical protein